MNTATQTSAPMRWSLALPTDLVDRGEEFGTAQAITEMAAALEAAGADACHVSDHPYPPASWVAQGGHHTLDPLVTLTCAAAATRRLILHTNILVLGYRHPVLAAHSLATLDALTGGGRLIVGTAVGYLEPEFDALGADFHRRGARLDEAIATMKDAWAGAEGKHGNVLRPLPATRPHPPLWLGGNSKAAIRRAVASAQGWMPFPARGGFAAAVRTVELADLADLRRGIASLRAAADAAGREEPIDICCAPFTHPHHRDRFEPRLLVEEAARMRELGVTWMSLRLPAPSRAGYLENVERFGAEVLRT
ncbi:TIGR03619 family F420-dependent LLM class oxidoreductase [Streptomyces sp. NPDC002896]|uniref:TIGR03619 family F420-dependent LLM class oxidoreductase n=1 Tax=Streptomyces sp. NPDC002896 TaxID=3154438 RepID=UPI00331A9339